VAVVSTLEDRLAAALRELSGFEKRVRISFPTKWTEGALEIAIVGYQNRVQAANALLAEYDASREACDCEHPCDCGNLPAHTHSVPHTRAHCQPAEPTL
jgi:hypothetical protein